MTIEALLNSGHAVASYTWSDIDPDANAAIAYRLARLHLRGPCLANTNDNTKRHNYRLSYTFRNEQRGRAADHHGE